MDLSLALSDPVRRWFDATFPDGPTAIQARAWPAVRAGRNVLAISPTGTGKTLAAFLAIVDLLLDEAATGALGPGVRCVYVSPLRSLGYDIERNLMRPLEELTTRLGLPREAVRVAVRTGDTSAYTRRRQREQAPHLLITTPESLSLLLTQPPWHEALARVGHLIVDEVHALAPSKRGADLAVSLERLAAMAPRDPVRIGLSATARPADAVARFLVGPDRACDVVAGDPAAPPRIRIEPLLAADEAAHRALSYRRVLRRLDAEVAAHRTTVIFANTRALAERVTHDLRRRLDPGRAEAAGDTGTGTVAAHHSALDAARRREVEAALKAGTLRAVVTSTSLELGVDIGSADLVAMIGLPGSVSRCLQRVGRAGHQVGATSEGVLYAATAAELAGAAVTVKAAAAGAVEPIRPVRAPLDVLCQQLLGMACAGECDADAAYALLRRTSPYADLARADLDACLAYLAGDLAAPAGAYEPEPGATPRWTAPRIWRVRGLFGVRSGRVVRWFRSNVGTITSEESVRVLVDGRSVGTLEGNYAERLQPGDRFVLDGRALEFRRLEGLTVHARPAGGEADLPRWTSDRQSLSTDLARDVAAFRSELARRAGDDGPEAAARWLDRAHGLDAASAGVLLALIEAQQAAGEVPAPDTLLVEESPYPEGFAYTFHAPLNRGACEVLGRATGARLGRRFGRDVALVVADLGWSLRLPDGHRLAAADLPALLDREGLDADALESLDRGELPARRFRHVAATALMVLRNPEGGRRRVGGLLWVSQRLYPLVKAACPDHPLLRETRREVLEDLLDLDAARAYLDARPALRFRRLEGTSPFTAAWIDPAGAEPIRFEPPADALKRLHARLTGTGE
jgi:ATP-dependent Lhr-like helicase